VRAAFVAKASSCLSLDDRPGDGRVFADWPDESRRAIARQMQYGIYPPSQRTGTPPVGNRTVVA
jgi:hypothetical protein